MNANSEYRTRSWLGIVAWMALAHAASAQVPIIQPSDSLGEGFEWVDSDINDGTIVSGSVGTAVRVFERASSNDWVQVATLPLDEGPPGVERIAVYRDMAIATTFSFTGDSPLYVFARRQGEWQRVQKLPFSSIQIALGARLAAVADDVGRTPSVVHVFRKQPDDTLELEATLTGDDGVPFGFADLSVAIAGDQVLVGTPRVNESRGAVRVFENVRGEWRERETLTPSDSESTRAFGHRLQTVGHVALIDADPGAYVFQRVGRNWIEQARLSGDPFSFTPFLVDRHRVVVELRTDAGVTRYLARIGGVDGWTPIVQLGPVVPSPQTIHTTRGFALSFEGGEAVVYDLRPWH